MLTGQELIPKNFAAVVSEQAKLKRWNFYAFLLHLGSSLFMAPFVRLPLQCMSYSEWTVQATYVTVGWNSTTPGKDDCGKDECTIQQCTHYVGGTGIPLESLVFGFHFGSALAHLGFVLWPGYYDSVCRRGNPWRWLEYAVTASLMIVVIMVTVGIVALWELVSAAVLTAVTQFFGWLCEVLVQRRDDELYDYRKRIFWVGAFTALPPWVAIMFTYQDSVNNSKVSVPWFVTVIVIALAVMFGSFAMVMCWRLRDNKEQRSEELNVKAEKAYIILSFISKALLAWLLWFGAFRRSSINLKQAPPAAC